MTLDLTTGLDALQTRFSGAAFCAAPDVPDRNLQDEGGIPATRPLALIRPDTVEGIVDAVKICAAYGIQIVPQGGLSGVVGGAHPQAGSIALSTERFSGVEEIDTDNSTMTIRAGTPLEVAQKAAVDAGLLLPLDLGSRGSCNIGGVLSTNAGGNRVIRYGMARALTLGLEVVLPDGQILSNLGKMIKNNSGYDLKQIFIGAEGTLGLITRAVLRLVPEPTSNQAALIGVKDYAAVVALLTTARRSLGASLSAFEVMWPDYWDVATSRYRSPLSGQHGMYVLCETQGIDEGREAEQMEACFAGLFEAGLIEDAVIAKSLSEVTDFWTLRDASGDLHQLVGPYIAFDIGLPIRHIGNFVTKVAEKLRAIGYPAVFYGHIGDGNLHINVYKEDRSSPNRSVVNQLVYEICAKFEGIVSAEHGIGETKKAYLGYCRSDVEISTMRLLKSAFDPKGTFNPGRIFDSLPAD